eukprot:TRINITY_DN26066_c0_g1_i1.p1 TRINITY_DN26066_c0_g1~~TRINITY_DN26066_c0_g1_i1.p1  ORF type:complete len:202 (+),score=26.67 TRINITY_DN26066_c0_g1_i1:65-670(+)
MIIALVCLLFSLASCDTKFERYIFTSHRKNVVGTETSRPLFAGITMPAPLDDTTYVTTFDDSWVCFRLPIYDLTKRKVGNGETCMNTNYYANENYYFNMVSSLRIKEMGTLVISWAGELGSDVGGIYTLSGTFEPTILGSSMMVQPKIMNDLCTGVFRHKKGNCQINGLIDIMQFWNSPVWTSPLQFERLYFDCRFENTDE